MTVILNDNIINFFCEKNGGRVVDVKIVETINCDRDLVISPKTVYVKFTTENKHIVST